MAEDEDGADELEKQFSAVTEEVIELRRRKFGPDGDGLKPHEEERLWQLVADWLDLFAAKFDQAAAGRGVQPTAYAQIIRHAAFGIREALDGFLPLAWREKPREERRSSLPRMKREAILVTASYYKLINEGVFADKKPTAFLAKIFNVTPRYIQEWSKSGFDADRHEFYRKNVLAITGSDEELPGLRREKMRDFVRLAAAQRRRGLA